MIGFFWLFILFIVIGGSFYHLYQIGGQAAIVVLYILCQIFFNFGMHFPFSILVVGEFADLKGPNATTYILPAELFPTRYRALCHGISAASGKLGSVVAQVFLAYINYGNGINYKDPSKWLPYSLLMFVFLPSLPPSPPLPSLPWSPNINISLPQTNFSVLDSQYSCS